jgi:hypothetical protein
MSINTGHSSPTLQFHIRALVLSITKLFMNASPLIGKELLYYDFRLNLFHKWLTYFSAHMLQPYLSHYTIKISILWRKLSQYLNHKQGKVQTKETKEQYVKYRNATFFTVKHVHP